MVLSERRVDDQPCGRADSQHNQGYQDTAHASECTCGPDRPVWRRRALCDEPPTAPMRVLRRCVLCEIHLANDGDPCGLQRR
jgi:hypothetical protein